MPENEVSETQDGQAGAPVAEISAETKMQKYEREQLSRRAALRKMGYTSALAAFALFGADDVVRLVGRRMQRQAGDDRVAELVAREFQEAGIALAYPPGAAPLSGPCGGENAPIQNRDPCCSSSAVGDYCGHYSNYTDCSKCIDDVYGPNGYCTGFNNPSGDQTGAAVKSGCLSTPVFT